MMQARDAAPGQGPMPDGMPERAFRAMRTVTVEQLSALVPHANNVQIVGWIDEAARAHGDSSGLTRERMHREGRMWFVARHEIDYLAESFAGDQILVGTWLAGVTKTTAMRATKVWRRHDGAAAWELAVDALSRWVHMDLGTRRPSRIPAADLRVYGWTDGEAHPCAPARHP
ncbi:MAG: acyl-CoA thioesterase [Phycisphaerales bacterium]|nr:acyl-CoA thioesterase [Phycisphaerales bacterium]